MRIRSTKPEFWRSKTIARLPWDVRLVLKGLESYVDDNGVGKDDIALIAADVFPRDLSGNPRDTLARLSEAISQLEMHGLIARYELVDEELLYIDKWKDLQRIDKPGRGRFPRPDGSFEYSDEVDRASYRDIRDTLASPPERVAPGTGEQGNRGTEEQRNSLSSMTDTEFENAWTHWPKKDKRKDAQEQFVKAVKKVGLEHLTAKVIEFGNAYAVATEKRFIPALGVWLRAERWTDELPTASRGQVSNVDKFAQLARKVGGSGQVGDREIAGIGQ